MDYEANRKKWTETLRSGEYEQGRHTLKKDQKFCCIGVAADLAGWNELNIKPDGSFMTPEDGYQMAKSWLGLQEELGRHYVITELGAKNAVNLSSLNDSRGYSFDDIADLIDSRPQGMFID